MTQAIHNDSNRNSATDSDYAHTDSARIKNLGTDEKRVARRDASQDLRTVNRAIRELENKDSADQARREALEELKKDIETFLNELTEATRADRESESGVDTSEVDTTTTEAEEKYPVTVGPNGEIAQDFTNGDDIHVTAADSTEDRTYILNPADPAPVPGEDPQEAQKTLEQRLIDDGVIDPETKEVIQDVNGDGVLTEADIEAYKAKNSLDTNSNLEQRQKITFDGGGKTKLSIASIDEGNKQLTVRIENLETGVITFQTIVNYDKASIIWSNAEVDRDELLALPENLKKIMSIDNGATTISANVEESEGEGKELDVTRSNGYKAATSDAAFDASRNMWTMASRTDLRPYWKEAIEIFYQFYTNNPKGDWKKEFTDKILKKWDEAGLLGADRNNLIISMVMTMFHSTSKEVFSSFAGPLVELFENQLMADFEVIDGRTNKAQKDAQGNIVMRHWKDHESASYKTVILLLEYQTGGGQFGGALAAYELFTTNILGSDDPIHPESEIQRGRWWDTQTNKAALDKFKNLLKEKGSEIPDSINKVSAMEDTMASSEMVDFDQKDYESVYENLDLYVANYCWDKDDVEDTVASANNEQIAKFQEYYEPKIDSLLQAIITDEPMPAAHIVAKLEAAMSALVQTDGKTSLGVLAAMFLIIMDGSKPQILNSLMKVPGFKEEVKGWLEGFDSSYQFYNPVMEILNRNYQ